LKCLLIVANLATFKYGYKRTIAYRQVHIKKNLVSSRIFFVIYLSLISRTNHNKKLHNYTQMGNLSEMDLTQNLGGKK